MSKVLDYIGARLKEPSTYEGLVVLAGIVGVSLSPEQAEAIVTLAGAIYGAIKVLKKEKRPE